MSISQDDPYRFKYCPDQIIRRRIPEDEVPSVLKIFHNDAYGGHFSVKKTVTKILQCGLYWSTLFKDTNEYYCSYVRYLMLSIYRLILNYNFVSFLVFCNHFYVSFMYFSCKLQNPWKFTKGAKKPQNGCRHMSQGKERTLQRIPIHCSENYSHCSEEPQDQRDTRVIRAYLLQRKYAVLTC